MRIVRTHLCTNAQCSNEITEDFIEDNWYSDCPKCGEAMYAIEPYTLTTKEARAHAERFTRESAA